MAQIDSRNARILQDNTDIASANSDGQDLRNKIEDIAIAENVTIDYGTDTPSDVLDNISGRPIEISTSAEMDAVLTADNVGKVYRFVGTTDSDYTNGDLYEVEASS